MATLWKNTEAGYEATQVGGEDVYSELPAAGRITEYCGGNRPEHVFMSDVAVNARVNGAAVIGGFRVLQHKDEIVIDGQQMFYSAESKPEVEIYQHEGTLRRPRCPICRAKFEDGESVVRCPGCARMYHLSEATKKTAEKPCWTFSPTCRFCEHPTSMSGEPSWRPDEEEQ